MERNAEDYDRQIEEEMKRRQELEREAERAAQGELPDGMGNALERADHDPHELQELRHEFNEHQERFDSLKSDIDDRQFEMEQKTSQQPEGNVADVEQEWLRRRYGEDPELTAMQAEQREQVEDLKGEAEHLAELREQIKQERMQDVKERMQDVKERLDRMNQ